MNGPRSNSGQSCVSNSPARDATQHRRPRYAAAVSRPRAARATRPCWLAESPDCAAAAKSKMWIRAAYSPWPLDQLASGRAWAPLALAAAVGRVARSFQGLWPWQMTHSAGPGQYQTALECLA